ncbi:MAG: hypothetical protein QGH40_04015 [bacterium]|nr:hypothetical protein [bacterium]
MTIVDTLKKVRVVKAAVAGGMAVLVLLLGVAAAGAGTLETVLHREVEYHPVSGLRLAVEGQDADGNHVFEERLIPAAECVAGAYFYYGPMPGLYKAVLLYRYRDTWYVIGDVLFWVERFEHGEELRFDPHLDVAWEYDRETRVIDLNIYPDLLNAVPEEFAVPLTRETVREKLLFEELHGLPNASSAALP